MRIDVVKASAFGPFMGETLELGSSMNVIYGPNESGKSSWLAAIYAALCGMRRTRGQPTREDRAFANRHRPWRGTTWRVAALVTLDDGRTVEFEQELGPGGRSTAIDKGTSRTLTGDLVREGAVDAATLLGLTRETALATVFVRQADILRVLNDATSLQEYLERAAATSTVDTTADEALAGIAAYKRDRVGVLRVGARGPLAVASLQLKNARATLDEAEADYESYQQLLARKHTADIELSAAEQSLAELLEHEQKRAHREQWLQIWASERQLEQAKDLEQEAAAGPQDSGSRRELIARVTRALTTYENSPAAPPELEGATAEAVESELAGLPMPPTGDLEPAPEVMACHDAWKAEMQRLSAHDENQPSVATIVDLPAPAAELRRLADELEVRVPEIDRSLADEVERRRSAFRFPPRAGAVGESRRKASKQGVLAIGALTVVVGAALVVLGQMVVGFLAILAGASVSAGAVAMSVRDRALQHEVPPLRLPPLTDELTRLEARLVLQEESKAQAERRRETAAARVAELDIKVDPSALRQIAADAETSGTAQARFVEWERRRTEITAALSSAADDLRASLRARGMEPAADDDLEYAFSRYVASCRERRETARLAGRRADLEAQLASRRAAEAARDHDIAARAAAERELLVAAEAVGCTGTTPTEVTSALHAWVRDEEIKDEARQKRAQVTARLDQLLDGHTIDDLQSEIAQRRSMAGDPPPADAPALVDRSTELENLEARARALRDKAGELAGQLDGAEAHLRDVSEAIEAEARADAEVRRLTHLAEDLDYASEILAAAQQKVHADIAPVLNETLRPWTPRITQGRYDDIRVNPATLELDVRERGGQFRSASVLSHGTTEQLFLLLRLALAEHLATTGESAPIVLDDVTVQSDARRTMAILDLLRELSKRRQVVLFSQEDEVLRWADETLEAPSDRLIRLEEPSG